MNDKKLQALVTLLDDPDDSVFGMVKQEILKEDTRIIEKLEQIWETSLDELMQVRIEDLIQQIQIIDTKKQIAEWAKNDTQDLLDGFFLISRYQYPDLKHRKLKNSLEKITKDIWLEFNNSLTALEKITVINHILYNNHKFSINHPNINSPQNCYFNQLLETRKGSPVSLAIFYLLITRNLNLPVYFIDFPKSPILAYIDPQIANAAQENENDSSVLFYINPSNKGMIIGRKDLEYHIKKLKVLPRKKLLTPCSDKKIIKRLLKTLIRSYDGLGYQNKVEDLQEILTMIL